jgi:hypothetical protein
MFRFTIRDVLWLTVVVALGVGWKWDRVIAQSKIKPPPPTPSVYIEGMSERLGLGETLYVTRDKDGRLAIFKK